ncbi:hypothetical protein BG004_005504 [Podila humilis]|nr:hypothetical protein BG004_005504 [Podila humilis]
MKRHTEGSRYQYLPERVDLVLLTAVEHQRKLVHVENADYEHKGPLASDEYVAVQLGALYGRLQRHRSVFVCGMMADDIVVLAIPALSLHCSASGLGSGRLYRDWSQDGFQPRYKPAVAQILLSGVLSPHSAEPPLTCIRNHMEATM